MLQDKPDRFGQYRETMISLHDNFAGAVASALGFPAEELVIEIHQMSFFEYIEEKHDENYDYLRFRVLVGRLGRSAPDEEQILIVPINRDFGGNTQSIRLLQSLIENQLAELWTAISPVRFEYAGTMPTLIVDSNDTIQTIHFFRNGTQLFKIIYSYIAFGGVLEAVR